MIVVFKEYKKEVLGFFDFSKLFRHCVSSKKHFFLNAIAMKNKTEI